MIGLFFGIYFIILQIGKEYDPHPMKEKFDYNTFNPRKFISNKKMNQISQFLKHRNFNEKYVNMNGYHSILLYKKETVNEIYNDPLVKKIPLAAPSTLNTKWNIFYFITQKEKVSKEDIISFSEHCCTYSIKNMKGLPRGLWSGTMSISVIMSTDIDKEAIEWVEKQPPKHFAAMEVPVILDIKSLIPYHYDNSNLWGGKIYPYAIALINRSMNVTNPSYEITNSIMNSLRNNL